MSMRTEPCAKGGTHEIRATKAAWHCIKCGKTFGEESSASSISAETIADDLGIVPTGPADGSR